MLRFKLSMLMVLGVALGMFVAAPLTVAEEKVKDGKDGGILEVEKNREQEDFQEELAAAYRMAATGRKLGMPEALIAAARIIARTPIEEFTEKETDAKRDPDMSPKKEAEALLAEALKMPSASKDAIKALAAAAKKDLSEKPREAKGFPRTFYGNVSKGNRTDTFRVPFVANRYGRVHVNNYTNRGDIDVYVYNQAGRLVARDRRTANDASVNFFVPSAQTYTIKVNLYAGKGLIRYRVTTN